MNNLVSIIVPVYNGRAHLPATIKSVLEQTYPEWELIIVDDGSTDDTQEVVKPYLVDERIRYHFKTNSGVSDTRNTGASLAKGNFLCFLDADDIFFPENLALKLDHLLVSSSGMVFSDVMLLDADGQPTGEFFIREPIQRIDQLLLWDRFNIPGPSSILIRKEINDKVGGWDPAFSTAADQDFFFRVAAVNPIGHINKALTGYRVLPDSMSRNLALMEKDHVSVYKKAAKNKLFKSFWFKQRCFSNLYFILAGSWWKEGHHQIRAAWFLMKSLCIYPPAILKIIQKIKI